MYPVELITCEGVLRGIIYEDGSFEDCEVRAEYVAIPTFFNAHAHLLDSIAKDIAKIDLRDAIRYKFEILKSKGDDEIRDGVRVSIEIARRSGTSEILNFTEMGLRGFKLMRDFEVLALTRPENLEEAEILADLSFGFGMSSVRDHDYRFLEEIREIARKRGKVFAIHAGEVDDGDVEDALALEPDLLIHMNMASVSNLRRAMDMEIPIVSCIRSNAFFGLMNIKNYEILVEYDLWMLGTDNAMVCSPSMIDEMHFASYILGRDEEVFKACLRGFKIFNAKPNLLILNRRYNLHRSRDLIRSVVRRVNVEDFERIFRLDKKLERLIF